MIIYRIFNKIRQVTWCIKKNNLDIHWQTNKQN